MGDNMIWIPKMTLTEKAYQKYIREIVYHEILHAVKGIEHNDKCLLMSSNINKVPISKRQAQRIFLTYFK